MYTKVKDIQILIALMKKHHVMHVVMSAGSRHVPFVQSVETDPDFTCYSVVDERSAGYYAIGLSKALDRPVAIVCTSSTATLNYYPAVREAARQNIPLLVLTADRHPAYLNQLEDQMIDQPGMYGDALRKYVTLPWINSQLDSWQCQRLVNEALLELTHHGRGPVQINFPNHTNLKDNADLSVKELPGVKYIQRLTEGKQAEEWAEKAEELKAANRILVLCGEMPHPSERLAAAIDAFAERYNCVIATEKVSNLHCKSAMDTYLLSYAFDGNTFDEVRPEIVISVGGNFYSRFKALLRGKQRRFRHWSIDEGGRVIDAFQSLNVVFESDAAGFFEYFAEQAAGKTNSQRYLKALQFRMGKIAKPAPSYSSYTVIKALTEALPAHSLVHLSILNSTRISQLFPFPEDVRAYSNLGTYGIDGSMSTFLGQASVTDRPSFLVIGDLSFFYDMNALDMEKLPQNIRIVLINNGGAAEFHFSMGMKRIPTINRHIAAEHSCTAQGWLEANGFRYFRAENQEQAEQGIRELTDPGLAGPAVLEVLTRKEEDAEILNKVMDDIKLPFHGIPEVQAGSADTENLKETGQVKKIAKLIKRAVKGR